MPNFFSDIIAGPSAGTPMMLLLAKATLILLAALGITVAMQRASAGARHLVWLVTLGTLLLVPAVAMWAPLRLEILPARATKVVAPQTTAPNASLPREATTSVKTDGQPAVANTAAAAIPSSESPGLVSRLSSMSAFSAIVTIWSAVVLVLCLSLAYGALAVRRIVRNARPLDSPDWSTPLWEVADRLSLEEPPRLLGSDDAKMPFACGILKPTIVLPADCESWSLDRRRAVLLHELAHVRRHDLIGHTLGRLACAVYWFHPLVWTAAKKLRSESERACDDLALACGARASDYAEHLLDIVTSVRHDSTPAVALAMARRKEFEGRMLAILDPELRHSSPTRRQSMALIASLAVISMVVGAAAPAPRPARTVVDIAPQPTRQPQLHDVADPQAPKGKQLAAAAPESLSIPLSGDMDNIDRIDNHKAISKSIANSIKSGLVNGIKNTVGASIANSVASSVASSVTNAVTNTVTSSVTNSVTKTTTAKVLENLLGDRDKKEQGKGDDRPILLAGILKNDGDASLRRIAAWGLGEYAESPVAVEALATALRRDQSSAVREMAAWALAQGDESPTTADALAAALRGDSELKVRATAAWALGQVGNRESAGPLSAALSDQNQGIRMRAAWALGQLNLKDAPRPLIAMLRDSDPRMREVVAWALFQIEDPAAVPALEAALKGETDKDLQLAYIRALAATGERSVDAIRGLLQSSDPRIRSMAVRALAGGHGAGPWPWPWPEPRPSP
jgi:beta-lactamase regulating signal transducer with metallopeptidase domain/HEAT repeat protein